MDSETNNLIARQYLSEKNLSQVEPSELVAWAVLEIERGHDDPTLRKLAAESGNENSARAESLFRQSISQLGWEIPSKKASLRRYSEWILQSIVDGSMEPYDGCSQLYINSIFLKHPDYLYNWNGLFWAREDLEVEELNELILEEARIELGLEATPDKSARRRVEEEDEELPGFWERLRELVKWR
jgi:hypothetical protein